jgi:hypothetical protein
MIEVARLERWVDFVERDFWTREDMMISTTSCKEIEEGRLHSLENVGDAWDIWSLGIDLGRRDIVSRPSLGPPLRHQRGVSGRSTLAECAANGTGITGITAHWITMDHGSQQKDHDPGE